jgi:hypothetical protein
MPPQEPIVKPVQLEKVILNDVEVLITGGKKLSQKQLTSVGNWIISYLKDKNIKTNKDSPVIFKKDFLATLINDVNGNRDAEIPDIDHISVQAVDPAAKIISKNIRLTIFFKDKKTLTFEFDLSKMWQQ